MLIQSFLQGFVTPQDLTRFGNLEVWLNKRTDLSKAMHLLRQTILSTYFKQMLQGSQDPSLVSFSNHLHELTHTLRNTNIPAVQKILEFVRLINLPKGTVVFGEQTVVDMVQFLKNQDVPAAMTLDSVAPFLTWMSKKSTTTINFLPGGSVVVPIGLQSRCMVFTNVPVDHFDFTCGTIGLNGWTDYLSHIVPTDGILETVIPMACSFSKGMFTPGVLALHQAEIFSYMFKGLHDHNLDTNIVAPNIQSTKLDSYLPTLLNYLNKRTVHWHSVRSGELISRVCVELFGITERTKAVSIESAHTRSTGYMQFVLAETPLPAAPNPTQQNKIEEDNDEKELADLEKQATATEQHGEKGLVPPEGVQPPDEGEMMPEEQGGGDPYGMPAAEQPAEEVPIEPEEVEGHKDLVTSIADILKIDIHTAKVPSLDTILFKQLIEQRITEILESKDYTLEQDQRLALRYFKLHLLYLVDLTTTLTMLRKILGSKTKPYLQIGKKEK